ncbi:ATP-binding protein [Marinilabiliaceae bacterium ANBcel2]|nr:ATP-binding protein [Marinilabiliaceae bacterium ANBcel2]
MNKNINISLIWKVVLTTVAGLATVLLIHAAIELAFDEITTNINKIAQPNEKLTKVNKLFREVSQLNHFQHEDAASIRRNPSHDFMRESDAAFHTIDTLKILFDNDEYQQTKIKQIDSLLQQRESLFTNFLELQYRHNKNPDIKEFLDKSIKDSADVNIHTPPAIVQKETVTTTTETKVDTIREERAGFFKRLFNRAPQELTEIISYDITTDTATKISYDTIAPNYPDTLIAIWESRIDSLHSQYLKQSALIKQQELHLINTNSRLIHEIINIINDLEQTEIGRLRAETRNTFNIAGTTIERLNHIILIFIAITVILAILMAADISKSASYRKKLEIAHQKAQNEAEARKQFLSNMSHEIRTPLQTIYGYAEQLIKSDNNKSNIEPIYSSAEHLLDVVNEVLDYSKVTSGKIIIEKRDFNLYKTVQSVATSFTPISEKQMTPLKFNYSIDKDLILKGDPFKLKQIIYNLLGNALKFTSKGEINLTVKENRQKSTDKTKQITILVKDTGEGIDSDKLNSIFDPYNTIIDKDGKNSSGTGLGLAIVKKIVEAKNGNVEVISTPGKGTLFTVEIPFAVGEKTKDYAIKPAILKSFYHNKYNFILTDDDKSIRDLAKSIFKKWNIDLITFKNGEELAKSLSGLLQKPTIIFLDIRMPGISGTELCKYICNTYSKTKDVTIYALTAQTLIDEQKKILSSGFKGIIEKPFKEVDIITTLNNHFNSLNRLKKEDALNPQTLIDMTGSEKELIEILSSIYEETKNDLTELKESLNKKDLKKVSLIVHRLAGRSGQAGAKKFAAQLRDTEIEIENRGDFKKIVNQVELLIDNGYIFLKKVENFIDNKKDY